MDKKEAERKHPPRPASAMREDKISLAHFDGAHAPAPRPASAPAASTSPPTARPDAPVEEEIQVAEPTIPFQPAALDHPPGPSSKNVVRPVRPWEIDLSNLIVANVIGKGAFGCVYKGDYGNQDVAVKLLDWGEEATMTKAEIDGIRKSYIQEASVWHKLSHPNVTKFLGAHIGDTRIKTRGNGKEPVGSVYITSSVGCIVEEFMHGGNLRHYLARHSKSKISYELAIKFARDLAKGLSYLHSQAVVHRDVKPDNLLLDSYMNLKIADFGVSRLEAKNAKDMTGDTGTLHYMAPEVVEGKPYNRSCDVYSFGVCLWEIYNCEEPYKHYGFSKYVSEVVLKNVRPPIPKCCPVASYETSFVLRDLQAGYTCKEKALQACSLANLT
ncbi:hypothetical protein GOP47_0021767 [Adiantum capillus-veneris]|uniref:Protein kinase domain-containing protein n=1 Tax=Adiantum capillus-veneris TaxID=13818 RepID=A0A9D4Z6V5_ADICA|nr:hypothetical protein GOP47_0021767 [Adiantum capillus-veneris]